MKNDIINKMLKEIPLETRVKVTIQSYFLTEFGGSIFMPLDENGDDIPEVVEANTKCYEMAKPLIEMVMEDIEKWKKDGSPK